MLAYHLNDYQIEGGRDWTDSIGRMQYYDIAITTRSGRNPLPDQVPPMLDTVLADRFRLKFHRETKELPGFDLVVGADGPKFAVGRSAVGPSPTISSSRAYTGNLYVTGLARLLAFELRHPVRDKSGVSGVLVFAESIYDPPDKVAFAEVQDQLGLQLVPATVPVEVLVIDHAERPSEN